ncbi:MAG: hypothetical protein M3167_03795 [Acidobacteriota bacterium]|nr:hypothetical protein [Acidobacteriota bacterium]
MTPVALLKARRGRTTFRLLCLAAAFLGAEACKEAPSAASGRLPTGDAVWLSDGTDDGAGETEAAIVRGGFGSVFVPVTRLVREGDRWNAVAIAPPATRFSKLPVTLVISAGEEAAAALAAPQGSAPLGDAAWLAAKAALRDGARFGRVRGIHLDVPFAAANAEAFGSLLRGLRSKLPPEILLTQTLRVSPTPEQQEAMRKAATASDGWVAFLFGEGGVADAAAADGLERPWLAAYSPAAVGRVGSGAEERIVPESVLAVLTDDPHVEFSHDLTLKEESASAFLLTPHAPVSARGFSFRPGDRVRFRQPSLSDMVYRFGADLAGKRFVRGRVVLLSGRSEQQRIFTAAAMSDILLGRPLNTDLRVSIETTKAVVTLAAENPTPHASLVSRTSNWIEVEVPQGGISDVKPGGFDRFEVFGPEGGAVTLGRATRLRFFETLVSPWEKIEAARILVRRPPRKDCCVHRIHVLSSAGAEVTREGDLSGTPSPSATAR